MYSIFLFASVDSCALCDLCAANNEIENLSMAISAIHMLESFFYNFNFYCNSLAYHFLDGCTASIVYDGFEYIE
jgi:hypothetical protein